MTETTVEFVTKRFERIGALAEEVAALNARLATVERTAPRDPPEPASSVQSTGQSPLVKFWVDKGSY